MAQSIECDVVSRPYDGTMGFLLRYWYDALDAGARRLRAEGYPPGWIEETIASARIGAFDYSYDLDERLAMDLKCHENRDAHYPVRLMSRDDFHAVMLGAIDAQE